MAAAQQVQGHCEGNVTQDEKKDSTREEVKPQAALQQRRDIYENNVPQTEGREGTSEEVVSWEVLNQIRNSFENRASDNGRKALSIRDLNKLLLFNGLLSENREGYSYEEVSNVAKVKTGRSLGVFSFFSAFQNPTSQDELDRLVHRGR
ncbi:hypothetical protein A0O36_02843 [Piscirickettsiaceae bacterium NZ-RLO1]|nr:hypothetical protein A0O36_02843 [Piscirickettsiaceae bacterium NZ-RLO1]